MLNKRIQIILHTRIFSSLWSCCCWSHSLRAMCTSYRLRNCLLPIWKSHLSDHWFINRFSFMSNLLSIRCKCSNFILRQSNSQRCYLRNMHVVFSTRLRCWWSRSYLRYKFWKMYLSYNWRIWNSLKISLRNLGYTNNQIRHYGSCKRWVHHLFWFQYLNVIRDRC